jgi:RNA polymerase sigma factor (sigma-70 family)
VQRLQVGDAVSLSTLRKGVQAHLCDYFSQKFSCSVQDAEELTADVLVRVHKAVGTFDLNGGAKLTTWIFQIAHNLGVDWIRKQKQLTVKGVAAGALDAAAEKEFAQEQVNVWFRDQFVLQAPTKDESTRSSEFSKKIQSMKRARESLNEHDLGLIEMRLSMSNREIANAEGVAEGTIRTRYSRAVARLTAAYEREMNL